MDIVSNMKPIQIPNEGGKQVNILGIPMVIRTHGRVVAFGGTAN